MTPLSEIEFFRCYICQKYKPISDCKVVRFKDLIHPKDVCNSCFEEVQKKEGKKDEKAG
jgi:hypothetical protein